MDTRLMELLVCPLCKGELKLDPQTRELVCTADRLAFAVRDGIAVMLESEARSLDMSPPDAASPITTLTPEAPAPGAVPPESDSPP